MLILELDLTQENYVLVGEEPYFVFEGHDGRRRVYADRCPHRGGPLHLGRSDCQTHSITCPWHDTVISERTLSRRSVPSVAMGRVVTAVFPVEAETPCQLQHRRLLSNEH